MNRYVVVGGGLSGLTAAVALGRAGHAVTVLEQSRKLGGRAHTENRDGFLLNIGPHALYRNGPAYRTLREWGIPFSGHAPVVKENSYVVVDRELHPFPADPLRLFTTSAFRGLEKLSAARAFQTAMTKPAAHLTVEQWLDGKLRPGRARQLVEALVRVSTYCNDLGAMSARAAAQQVQFAIANSVLYLDGGWQTLVNGLAAKCASLGVTVITEAKVERVEPGMVHVAGRDPLACDGVIIAATPAVVESLTGVKLPALAPVRAACLDLALKSLPERATVFALGMDTPMYFSRHSAAAALAPAGASLVHVAKYLAAGATGTREELEDFADIAMPGWRDHVEFTRFVPDLAVTHAVVTPYGRPATTYIPGIAIAGDWVGDEGMLVDTAVASALRAAAHVTERRSLAAA